MPVVTHNGLRFSPAAVDKVQADFARNRGVFLTKDEVIAAGEEANAVGNADSYINQSEFRQGVLDRVAGMPPQRGYAARYPAGHIHARHDYSALTEIFQRVGVLRSDVVARRVSATDNPLTSEVERLIEETEREPGVRVKHEHEELSRGDEVLGYRVTLTVGGRKTDRRIYDAKMKLLEWGGA